MYITLAYYQEGHVRHAPASPLEETNGGYCMPAFPHILFHRTGIFQLVGLGHGLGLPHLRDAVDIVAYVGESTEQCDAFMIGHGSGYVSGACQGVNAKVQLLTPSAN